MKILMLNYEFPPLGGGAGNANYFLLKELADTPELEIDLITSSANKFYTEKFSQNITIHFINIGKRGKDLQYQSSVDLIKYSVKAFFYSLKLSKENKYDLTHAWFGIPSGLIAYLLKLLQKTPYIVSLRGADVPGYKKRFKWLDRLFFGWLNKFFIWKQADRVIANSQKLKKLALKTAPQEEIKVIPNGVDLKTFKPNWKKSLDKIKITTGWTRLEKRKGVDLILKAVAAIDDQDLEVVIPGTGQELGNLKQMAEELDIADQVKFLEIRENSDDNRQKVTQVLADCHILCLPSDNEGMSNAVLEGMANGLALLLTNVGGTEELLENNQNGYIIKRKTSDIAEKIIRLKDKKEILMQMGQESRKKSKQFSWKQTAGDYIKIYEQSNV